MKNVNELVPKIKPSAPLSLKNNVIDKIEAKSGEANGRKIIARICAVAAIVLLALIIPLVFSQNNTARASAWLGEAAEQIGSLKTMIMKILVRTTPTENFESFATDEHFVENTLLKSFETNRWRLSKSGRTIVYDGKNSFLWIESEANAFVAKERIRAGMFEPFLEPENLLENEQKIANTKGSKVKLDENENSDEIALTIESKAEGTFVNNFCKNTSIEESDCRRTYVFDKNTKLLKSFEVEVFENGSYVSVIKSAEIKYNDTIYENKLIALPANIEFIDFDPNLHNARLSNVSAKQAATLIMESIERGDISEIKEALYYCNVSEIMEKYRGVKVLEIGDSFKSGLTVDTFVPCKIKFADGATQTVNLALRNDNEGQIWIVDGGI